MSINTSPSPSIHARRAGLSATIGGPLLFAGAVASTIVPAQQPDGAITNTLLFALYTIMFTIGAALLVDALRALQTLHHVSGENLPRSLRIGTRISIIGLALLAMFGIVVGTTGVITGAPAEASFVAFGLGFLLTVIGHATLANGLRRAGILHRLWVAPLVAAAGALVALIVPDMWHDLGLFTFSAAWTTLGVQLIARARHATRPHVKAASVSKRP